MTSVISKSDLDQDVMVEQSPNNRYVRYDEVLSTGTFKIAYKGFDKDNGTEVVWYKSSNVAWNCGETLVLEAAKIKLHKHGNIIKCCDSWVDIENKTVNIITESCSSGTLRKFRMKHKGVDMKVIKKWARQILQGLCYLHSHSPPVVHGDLNCDDVFINGNGGEVKIGGLGFAAILQQGIPGTIMCAPEFMAPELFEGAYNQLVDIYAFGMCMLELVTCEYPYRECTDAGQIYKKIVSGVKPAALCNVKSPQAKVFIEKCLVPASQRMSAAELLNDPFLSCDNSKESPKFIDINLAQPNSRVPGEISSSYGKVSKQSRWSRSATGAHMLVTEFYISKRNKEWRLSGEKADDSSVSFVLLVKDAGLHKSLKFEYTFFPDTDNAVSVAKELVSCNEEELSNEDMPPTRELMDTLLLQLVPGWKSSDCGVKSSCEDYAPPENDQHFLPSCRELLRASHEAIENEKKRWLNGRIPFPCKSVLTS